MSDTLSPTDDIQFEVMGGVGHILLNRPKALNALTLTMCQHLLPKLQEWAEDKNINAVVVRGEGEKAFCAGGDIVRLYEDGRAGKPYPRDFWRTEYRCNTLIKHFPKPYIALVDGISMGGGVGLSEHGSYVVATDRTMFAMPETGIGLFPDVGGSYFLSRLDGAVGMYLALTGRRLKGAECVAWGVADTFLPSESMDALVAKLATEATSDLAQVTDIIGSFAASTESVDIRGERENIDKHFGHESVEAILASLDSDGSEWAAAQAKTMGQKSPLSMKVTFKQIKEGAKLDFADCMRMEWRLANRFAADHDFYEGVRALLVDKDMKPQWKPATLEEIDEARVNAYFAPLPGDELDLSDIVREN